MSDAIRIVEVGPRDGLQNEKQQVTAATKIELIQRLATAGLKTIEAGSFVSPKWVPQMADTAEVLAGLSRMPGVSYAVLVLNMQGLERALAAGAEEIGVVTAASDAFNQENTNCTTDESLLRMRPVVELARTRGLRVRGYVSTALGCPYQGAVPVSEVVRVAAALVDMGCEELSLGDTIGIGTARQAREVFLACAGVVGPERLGVHFHDTYGQALANTFVCVEEGCRTVDGSVAGLGGCPYAKGASGNLATEDLVYLLQGMGFATGVSLDALVEVSRWISSELGREPASKLARVKKAS